MPKIDWTDDAQPTREPLHRGRRDGNANTDRARRSDGPLQRRMAAAAAQRAIIGLPPIPTNGREPLHLVWGAPRPRAEVERETRRQNPPAPSAG